MKPILTAMQGTNADLFPSVLSIYLPKGGRVLDMTYGRGVFWKKADMSKIDLVRNDIAKDLGQYHDDFRNTRWADTEFDLVVLDPPYASRSSNKKGQIGKRYNNAQHGLATVEDMIRYYEDGMAEATRLLKKKGVLAVKCMDEVAGGKQRLNHVTILNTGIQMGLVVEDMFVLVQKGVPTMRHTYQLHARKNHSYFLVFRK
jgi:hypothetical protein